jgi:hypothetical protein
MNSPSLSLQELIELCKERNYTEEALGIKNHPGFIEERLRKGHAIMVLRSSYAKTPKNFTMAFPTTAYNQKDNIQLKFNVDYDPANDTIRLRGVTAYLNPTDIEGKWRSEEKKIFLFGKSQDLPDSNELYRKLTEHRIIEARQLYNKISYPSTVQNSLQV